MKKFNLFFFSRQQQQRKEQKDEEEKHLFYDNFIENFEETTKRWAKAKKYSRKRDEKICGNEQEN